MNTLNKTTPEQREAGQAVQDAQSIVDKYQGRLDSDKDLVLNMRNRKASLSTELEMLESKDQESMPYDLKLRMLDLNQDIKTANTNISNMESGYDSIQHSIDVANMTLKKSKQKYTEVVNPVLTGQLSSSDVEYLHSLPPLTKMPHAQKADIVSRFGWDAVKEHTKMI